MSVKIIELNDRAVHVGDETGVILQSPGFALAEGSSIVLGEAAERQARLQPTNSYNKFWHELSLDPISHGNNFRHFADIAYAHLMHLAEESEIGGDVIFAVPGNFTRQQLAILLGLVNHTPFKAGGVVNSAVAAAALAAEASNIIYIDLQLHQAVVTRLNTQGDHLQAGTTIQVPGVGSQNFIDLMMQMATGMFIQQCRFNPQHNADSEQQLYNELPGWLAEAEDGNLILELRAGETLHTAKMPRESLINSLGGHFNKINVQLAPMLTERDTQILISPAMAALPGFTASLPQQSQLIVLDQHAVSRSALEHQELIIAGDAGIKLVESLPVAKSKSANSSQTPQTASPTHVLFGHRAVPIKDLQIANQAEVNGHAGSANTLLLSITGLPEDLGRIYQSAGEVRFQSLADASRVNGKPVTGETSLSIGDQIQFGSSAETMTLIQVSDG